MKMSNLAIGLTTGSFVIANNTIEYGNDSNMINNAILRGILPKMPLHVITIEQAIDALSRSGASYYWVCSWQKSRRRFMSRSSLFPKSYEYYDLSSFHAAHSLGTSNLFLLAWFWNFQCAKCGSHTPLYRLSEWAYLLHMCSNLYEASWMSLDTWVFLLSVEGCWAVYCCRWIY